MRWQKNPGRARRGMAPLELVMALPILLLMAAFIYKVADAGLLRASANVRARRDAWAQRSPNRGAENNPLPGPSSIMTTLRHESASRGVSKASAQRVLDMAPMFSGFSSKYVIRGEHQVLGDTWDHQKVRFSPHGRFEWDPRLPKLAGRSMDALKDITKIDWGTMSSFFSASDLVALAGAGTTINKSKTDINDYEKKTREEMEKDKKKDKSIWEKIGDALNPAKWAEKLQAISRAKGLISSVGDLVKALVQDAPY